MAADVEAKTAVFDGARETAYVVRILLEDEYLMTFSSEFISGCEARWACSNNYDSP